MIAMPPALSRRSKRHTCLLAGALWLSAVAAYAQQPDEFINAEMQRQRIPGLALVVLKNGEVVTAKGYGLADVKQKTPVTAETVFKIGSVSKQFIATGIMLLVQEGRLGLNDPLSNFLNDAPPAAYRALHRDRGRALDVPAPDRWWRGDGVLSVRVS